MKQTTSLTILFINSIAGIIIRTETYDINMIYL